MRTLIFFFISLLLFNNLSAKEFRIDLEKIIYKMQETVNICIQRVAKEGIDEFDKNATLNIRRTLSGLSLYIKNKFEAEEKNIEESWKSTLKFQFNKDTGQ